MDTKTTIFSPDGILERATVKFRILNESDTTTVSFSTDNLDVMEQLADIFNVQGLTQTVDNTKKHHKEMEKRIYELKNL